MIIVITLIKRNENELSAERDKHRVSNGQWR